MKTPQRDEFFIFEPKLHVSSLVFLRSNFRSDFLFFINFYGISFSKLQGIPFLMKILIMLFRFVLNGCLYKKHSSPYFFPRGPARAPHQRAPKARVVRIGGFMAWNHFCNLKFIEDILYTILIYN